MNKNKHKLITYICGLKGLLFILYTVIVIFTYFYVSLYYRYSKTDDFYYILLQRLILIITLSLLICPFVLNWFSRISIIAKKNDITDKRITILFYVLPLSVFLVEYIAFYPGGYISDMFVQYEQVLNNTYNDWHPVTHTILFFKLPLFLTGGWIGSVVLFQIVEFSLIIGYSLNVLKKYIPIKTTIVIMAFWLLNPQVITYSVVPFKDTAFAGCALLLVTYLFNVFVTEGEWIKKPMNTVAVIIVLALMTLIRHNAILFTIPFSIMLFMFIKKKRAALILLCFVVIVAGVKGPVYSAIRVESPDKRLVETLGLPISVIGSAVSECPEKLDSEILEFAYSLTPKEVWESDYNSGSFNSIKWNEKTKTEVIEKYGAKEVVSIMLKCFKKCPVESMLGLINLTSPLYTLLDERMGMVVNVPIIENNIYGIEYKGVKWIKSLSAFYSLISVFLFPHLFMYLGVIHLLLILVVLSRKNFLKNLLLIAPLFSYNFCTALLLSGPSDSNRFFFYTYLTGPIILILLLMKPNNKEKNRNIEIKT